VGRGDSQLQEDKEDDEEQAGRGGDRLQAHDVVGAANGLHYINVGDSASSV